jgi:ABC-type multidrug transport system ATPase subunit
VCRCKGVPERHARRVAAQLLTRVGLGSQRGKLAAKLSGGNKRKLALACALVGRPSLLLLDEPSSGMDPHARRTLWSVVRGAIADRRRAVVLSTHLMEEAERVCTRVAVLVDGRFRAIGTPAHIKRAHGGGVVLEVQTRVARGELEGDAVEHERAQRERVCDLVAELLTQLGAAGDTTRDDDACGQGSSARSRAEAALIEHHAGKYKFLLERADYAFLSLARLFETFEAARRAELLTSFSLELCSMEHVLIGLIDQSGSGSAGVSG